ncbi:MliC family protein [Aliiroseovarius sp. M344]|uniref:MliC family protein n=1 Tax=Aliiroseovarius sp. M344 TaxID=2867010 RepID=UPI0021AE1968|nr:MliC family protein [Aliiroseovarius sp. M344]UWQ13451.1 MliC family protein [Aliiroseovarius sp. M344]
MLILPLTAASLFAAPSIQTVQYQCDRGAVVSATYLNAADQSFAVIFVEGQQLGLAHVISASGAKYAQTPDGAGYVWWTKGDEAFLAWDDVPNGSEETLLSQCHAM